jgi:hypothetical protein
MCETHTAINYMSVIAYSWLYGVTSGMLPLSSLLSAHPTLTTHSCEVSWHQKGEAGLPKRCYQNAAAKMVFTKRVLSPFWYYQKGVTRMLSQMVLPKGCYQNAVTNGITKRVFTNKWYTKKVKYQKGEVKYQKGEVRYPKGEVRYPKGEVRYQKGEVFYQKGDQMF